MKMKFSLIFTRISLLLLLLLAGIISAAKGSKPPQRRPADSLLMVKDYLLEIKAAIPTRSMETDSAVIKLGTLIRKATAQQAIMERQFDAFRVKDPSGKIEMVQQYRWVLQSAILLKTGLKETGFDSENVREEMQYLNKQLPALVHKLYYYSKKASAVAVSVKPK